MNSGPSPGGFVLPRGPAAHGEAATVAQWLVEARLSPDVARNVERLATSDDVCHVVILPDAHLGRHVNNGCVAATTDLIYPEAVGGDIGCGFSVLGFTGPANALTDETAPTVFRELYRRVPALKQRCSTELPESLRRSLLSDESLVKESRRDGARQLGTLGSGNHFVEFQQDDTGALWLMVHSGSRGIGQKIFNHHWERATPAKTGLRYLDLRSDAGRAYFNDMEWAVHYARLNRLAILAHVTEILETLFQMEADEGGYVDCPHNFARRETHFGRDLIVHRKSANSARVDEIGLIAGSMGSPSFVVRGLGHDAALQSSSHGAGRRYSRTEARQRIGATALRRQLISVHVDDRQIDDLRDEAPSAYRNIQDVLRAQRELIRQEARLVPILNFKYPDRRVLGRT